MYVLCTYLLSRFLLRVPRKNQQMPIINHVGLTLGPLQILRSPLENQRNYTWVIYLSKDFQEIACLTAKLGQHNSMIVLSWCVTFFETAAVRSSTTLYKKIWYSIILCTYFFLTWYLLFDIFFLLFLFLVSFSYKMSFCCIAVDRSVLKNQN
jgi:hypothetical protein